MNRLTANTFSRAWTVALLSSLSVGAWAQTTHDVQVNRGTVVYAVGNDLTIKMEDGTVKHFVVPADYSELGLLLISVTAIGFVLPLLAILILKRTRFRNA